MLGAPQAGKSTLVNAFAGLVTITSGQVLLCGEDRTNRAVALRHAVFVTPRTALYHERSARQNVEYFGALALGKHHVDRRLLEFTLRRAAVRERDFDRHVGDLGRGVEVRLLLAIGLIRGASALLLDDPTVDSGPREVHELQEFLRLCAEDGLAVFVATSSLSFATGVADRVGLLVEGRLVEERRTSDMRTSSLSELLKSQTGAV